MRNGHLGRYRTIGADRMPKKLVMDFIEEGDEPGPYGAKSIGECARITSYNVCYTKLLRAGGNKMQLLAKVPVSIISDSASRAAFLLVQITTPLPPARNNFV